MLGSWSKEIPNPSFSMTVMMFFSAYRHHASVRHFALHVFKSQCSVVDAEIVLHPVFRVPENAFADRRRSMSNGSVAGQSASFRADAADVEIGTVVHAVNG